MLFSSLLLLFLISEFVHYLNYKYRILPLFESVHHHNTRIFDSDENIKYISEYFTQETDIEFFLENLFKEGYSYNDLISFFGYTLYNKKNKFTDSQLEHIKELIDKIIKRHPNIIESIENDNFKDRTNETFMDGKLNCIYKPLVFYIFMRFVKSVCNIIMRLQGFECRVNNIVGLSIWLNKMDRDKKTILFIHGFGIGSTGYIPIFWKLRSRYNLVIVDLPNISHQNFIHPHPTVDKIVSSLNDMLNSENINKCDVFAHSYGTIISHLFFLKYPEKCDIRYYFDPVCFMIQQSYISNIKNITYIDLLKRIYKDHRELYTYFNIMIYFIVYLIFFKDIYTQFIMNRTFFTEHCLPKDIDTSKTVIVLSEYDIIVPSKYIEAYFKKHCKNVKIYMLKKHHHGEIIIKPNTLINIIDSNII
jgi:pimeloyl-ACP methyl ester carboxylesterase